MIEFRPYTPDAAMQVFAHLDAWDLIEAAAMRGETEHFAGQFADWHKMQDAFLVSWVLHSGTGPSAEPFAVCGAAGSGFAGVGQVAFLARTHAAWRRPIAAAAVRLREIIPNVAPQIGCNRLEARCLATHPTAAGFLKRLGFECEAVMPGFGASGADVFRLFSWTGKDHANVQAP